MPSPISRRPAGLLDLLLTQQQGRNPSELRDSVQPVMEMTPFYQSERLKISAVNANAAAVGSTATHSVPSGEYWKILSLGVGGVFANATQTIGVYATIGNLQSTNLLYLTNFGGTFASTATGDIWANGHEMRQPLILPSGAQIKFAVSDLALAAGAITMQSRVMYVRLET